MKVRNVKRGGGRRSGSGQADDPEGNANKKSGEREDESKRNTG